MENQGLGAFRESLSHITGLQLEAAVEAVGGIKIYEKLFRKVIHLLPKNVEYLDENLRKEDDLPTFAIKVHGIKSSLSQLGCLELAGIARELERASKEGDWCYCVENYGGFKEKLERFCEEANALVREDAGKAEAIRGGELKDYRGTILQAKEAAESFDSITATELLTPLAKIRFDGDVNALISDALNELESFRPRQAAIYITKLLQA